VEREERRKLDVEFNLNVTNTLVKLFVLRQYTVFPLILSILTTVLNKIYSHLEAFRISFKDELHDKFFPSQNRKIFDFNAI
jgi:hypothetical protein